MGLGEFIAVLNGVEFRTTHSDYSLRQPCKTCSTLHHTEDIQFPGVPQEVLAKPTLIEAIDEMREWFKAWRDDLYDARDYREYFKPVLCYLEGAWMKKSDFDDSLAHKENGVDASSWEDLQDKLIYSTLSGVDNPLEDLAYLPTILTVDNEGSLSVAQWDYRILCHPINKHLPLSQIWLRDELTTRVANGWTLDQLTRSRGANYQLSKENPDDWDDTYSLLDEIVSEIPGMNNYPTLLEDNALGVEKMSFKDPDESLNAGYYHRMYQVMEADEMGSVRRLRGFSDEGVFMALTDHSEVAEMTVKVCDNDTVACVASQRWSYMIPLEVIFITPLSSWNPYNLTYKGDSQSSEGQKVTDDRDGGPTITSAFDGINDKSYYMTPPEMFSSDDAIIAPADTGLLSAGVLDDKGDLHTARPSGLRVFLPDISGVGSLRQRYPIFPVHGQGGSAWKEVNALRDIIMRPVTHAYLYEENPLTPDLFNENSTILVLELKTSNENPHSHHINLTVGQLINALDGQLVSGVKTTSNEGHTHTLTLKYSLFSLEEGKTGKFRYVICDGGSYNKACGTHPKKMSIITA